MVRKLGRLHFLGRLHYYPKKVLVDKLYATRENRKWLKQRGIKISAKPLGRPSAQAVANHVRPGERNPIEGKFGQAKMTYGMNRIRAKLARTSESWIASIVLVLNLAHWTGQALYCLLFQCFSNGASLVLSQSTPFTSETHRILTRKTKPSLILDSQGWFYHLKA